MVFEDNPAFTMNRKGEDPGGPDPVPDGRGPVLPMIRNPDPPQYPGISSKSAPHPVYDIPWILPIKTDPG